MKIEYTSSDLQNMMDFSNELDVKKKLLSIIKNAMVEFGLTIVEETQQWKVEKTKNGGTKYPFDPDFDKVYLDSDDTKPKNLVTFITTWKHTPYITMTEAMESPYKGIPDVLNRIIEEYVVLYDKVTNSYLYIEISNAHKQREWKYDLWYDILFEYDKTKTYQEQKYGASISDSVPQIINDEGEIEKCFEQGVNYKPYMFTGLVTHYKFFMFSKELELGDSLLIIKNKGCITIAFANPKRELLASLKNHEAAFIYQYKTVLHLDKRDTLVATNKILAMDKNWRNDKRYHFYYNMFNDIPYLTYYEVVYKKEVINCVRQYIKNRLDFSFMVQGFFEYVTTYDENAVRHKKIPKMDATFAQDTFGIHSKNRNDNKLLSSLDNTMTKFPLIYYVNRQPTKTETSSAILENDCINMISATSRHSFDDIIERYGNDLIKSVVINKFFSREQTVLLLEYYRKQELLSNIEDDIIMLNDKILSYDKIIVNKNHTITSEELEEAFLTKKVINLTGDTNLLYNIVIETDRILRIKEKGNIKITSITGIRG